jgi:hypothetical protein
MTKAFREDLRRALAADAALPEHGFEDRLLAEFKEEISRGPQQRKIRRRRALDLETTGPRPGWVLVAAILAIVAVAALLLTGGLVRSRAVPSHTAPTGAPTSTPADPAVMHYRVLVDGGFTPLQQAGDDSFRLCGSPRPSVECRAATVRAKQVAQTFLDSLTGTSPPPGLQDAHSELLGGLRELIPAYDAQLTAIDSGDASQIQYRASLSYQIKAEKVYHGVADTDCWPKQTIQNQEGGLTWRCPR